MNIRIHDGKHHLNLVLPTRMIFSKTVLKLINFAGRHADESEISQLSPEAMDALFAEMRRIKKKYGSWELVDVESSDGEMVKIVL